MPCVKCGNTKIHVKKSMECRNCYDTRFRRDNPKVAERQRENCRKWHKANPERQATYNAIRRNDPELVARDKKSKWLNHLSKYNLTQDSYNKLLEKGCAICKRTELKAPHLDHCHKTSKFRGLLCSRCNNGLGMLGDNIKGLEKAINYLKRIK